jgi:hypothetical protein
MYQVDPIIMNTTKKISHKRKRKRNKTKQNKTKQNKTKQNITEIKITKSLGILFRIIDTYSKKPF